MADSENSRILPSIAPTNLLSAAATSLAAVAARSSGEAPDFDRSSNNAKILALWCEWWEAHEKRSELCVRQQTLETQILRTIGEFPLVKLNVPGKARPVFARTAEEIERALPGADMAHVRKCAWDKLRGLRKSWNTMDRKLGYSRAYQADTKAADLEWSLAAALWKTPAHSYDGIAAKLHALLEMHDPGEHNEESPWPILRSILTDWIRMNA